MENKNIIIKEGDILYQLSHKSVYDIYVKEFIFIKYLPNINCIMVAPYNINFDKNSSIQKFYTWQLDKIDFLPTKENNFNLSKSNKKLIYLPGLNDIDYLYGYDSQYYIKEFLSKCNLVYENKLIMNNETNTSSSQQNGYHKRNIQKGVLGEFSKIREEFEELADAVEQNNKVLTICELTDLIGAIKSYAKNYNLTLKDLNIFSESTENAFKSGKRT